LKALFLAILAVLGSWRGSGFSASSSAWRSVAAEPPVLAA